MKKDWSTWRVETGGAEDCSVTPQYHQLGPHYWAGVGFRGPDIIGEDYSGARGFWGFCAAFKAGAITGRFPLVDNTEEGLVFEYLRPCLGQPYIWTGENPGADARPILGALCHIKAPGVKSGASVTIGRLGDAIVVSVSFWPAMVADLSGFTASWEARIRYNGQSPAAVESGDVTLWLTDSSGQWSQTLLSLGQSDEVESLTVAVSAN